MNSTTDNRAPHTSGSTSQTRGVYQADLVVGETTLCPAKHFFPAEWSPEQVIASILDAYKNFATQGKMPPARMDGSYILKGTTTQGMIIRMLITADGTITKAYPIW